MQLALDFALIIVRTAHLGPGTANMPQHTAGQCCVTVLSNTGHLLPDSSIIRHISENEWKISYTHTHTHNHARQSIATIEPEHQVYNEERALLGVKGRGCQGKGTILL